MKQKFQVRVISLNDQHIRRNKISAELHQWVDWRFMDAISGKDLKIDNIFYNRKRRLDVFGYDLKINEIACFLSHRSVWKEAVEINQPILVLEDDVQIERNISKSQLSENINKLIDFFGKDLFVRLGNSHIRNEYVQVKKISFGFEVDRFYKDPLGAFAYVISPEVAKKLVEQSQTFFTPVDDFMWRGWEHGCMMYDVTPNLFFTQEEENPSTIGDRRKPKIGFLKKIRREYFRFLDNKDKMKYERMAAKKINHG